MNPIKIFLTSAICVCIFMPAIADIAVDSETPSCDYSTVGATSGNTSLEAIWNIVNSTCTAGQYFDMSTATCVTCTAGNFCPGGTYNVESETNGLNACPTGFVQSGAGASANTDCYRSCTTNDVAHSTAVNGEYYYGDNNQCGATACTSGYTVHPGNPLANTALTERVLDGMFYNGNTWWRNLDHGTVHGTSKCSAKGGDNGNNWNEQSKSTWLSTTAELDTAGEGIYCWCQVVGYTPKNGTRQDFSNQYWVYEHHRPSICEERCAYYCSYKMGWNGFRIGLYEVLGPANAYCEANTININWYNQNEIYDQNSCTYDDTVTLPEEPTRTGYTFDGWAVKVTE